MILLIGDRTQVSIHRADSSESDDSHFLLVMKGAAGRIVDLCSQILIDGSELEMDEAWKERINSAYLELGGMGERVLGT